MNIFRIVIFVLLSVLPAAVSFAQDSSATDDDEYLKIVALEALMSAPPERALPLVKKVLGGDGSTQLKKRALFVLGQINLPEARAILIDTASGGDGDLQHEAIRSIGIGGDDDTLSQLSEIYATGDSAIREAVLQAYLIAGDDEAVYQVAANAGDAGEFENAVRTLGAMGALEQLRALRNRPDSWESLLQAFAIAGDATTLLEVARDSSDLERQLQAIRSLGIVGGAQVSDTLVEIYRGSDASDIKEAALKGMLVAGHDEGVLQLYRESTETAEKRELLKTLVVMGGDATWDAIDDALEGGQ